MGAFFLFRESADIDVERAKQEFCDKGFQNLQEVPLGEWKIIVCTKMAGGLENYRFINGDAVFSAGAPIYRELNCSDSLARLLADCQSGDLDTARLLGHYNVIFFVNGQISVLCDPLNVKHLFTDGRRQFYTSSFLAAAAACRGEITLNRMAVYEKFLAGIIVSPDTVLKEIKQLDFDLMESINRENAGIRFIPNRIPLDQVAQHSGGMAQSVKNQGEALKTYFRKISAAARECGADIGLSGGYDSRLALAAADLFFHDCLHAHTHSTGHVHDREKRVALEMASLKGIPCAVIDTRRLDEPEAETEPLLLANLHFFDGRTAPNIGGISATYTACYRIQSTGGKGFTMTGVGGEVYRNNFSVTGKKIDMQKFLNSYVFSRSFDEALPDSVLRKKIRDYHLNKVEKRLGADLKGTVDMLAVRRYYSELMMPEGQGVVIDAYNQVSCCVAPFMEPPVIKEAYRGLAYFGSSGGYESAIIKYLDPALAHIESSYGYPLDSIPLKHKVKEWVRAHIPKYFWTGLARFRGGGAGDDGRAYLSRVRKKSMLLDNALVYLERLLPGVDYEKLLGGNSAAPNVAYLALVLYQWKDRLRNDE